MSEILCTICARGGSKGIPGKNVREVGGKPLVGHAISDARRWNRSADIVVSTDDDEIASVAEEYGGRVPFRRPAELASDTAGKLPAIHHAVKQMEAIKKEQYDYVVDVDATTPLRRPSDIEDCFTAVQNDDHTTNAYTVCEADKNPYFNMVELDEDGYASLSKEIGPDIVRRQDVPTVYEMNAAVYVYERDFLMETDTIQGEYTRVSVMPPERSVDIDTELDLKFVEFMFERREPEV
ncbi:cytidylyltransferase domain-containing protein [Halorientalis brevis]|uniref:Cytidylyltransferase domain-containing protein n=1 Tax=Halorientalis brevis TaxID=1126241 RepID=A0ABD6C6K6_9EURY|nr:acylneuraminate cytidylyltransferase family protein [Halorientalis brevis]